MKFNAHKPLIDLNGKVQREPVLDDSGKPTDQMREITLGYVASAALDHFGEERHSKDEKWRRFQLQLKLHNADGPVEITVEEAALIKRCVGEHPLMRPYVLGRITEEIERPEPAKSKPKGA